MFTACFLYADDIMLISPSLIGLQQILISNVECGLVMQLKFNCKKSCCTTFSSLFKRQVTDFVLCDNLISWVSNIKHLGLNFFSGKPLFLDVACIRRKFYTSCNSIYAILASKMK